MLIKIPFTRKYLAVLDDYPDENNIPEKNLKSYIESLKRDYKEGIWTPNINVITSDLECLL